MHDLQDFIRLDFSERQKVSDRRETRKVLFDIHVGFIVRGFWKERDKNFGHTEYP